MSKKIIFVITALALCLMLAACGQAVPHGTIEMDPTTGAGRVSYRDFVTAMENLPLLSGYTISGGSVTLDGTQATYVFDAATLQGSRETFHQGCILRLCRESGLWRVSLPQLTGWLEE